jgi:hypothetical protein
MTVHIISIGLSVLEVLAHPRTPRNQPKLGGDADLITDIAESRPHQLLKDAGLESSTDACAWLAGALAPTGDPASNPAAAAALIGARTQARPQLWPSGISAELSTFAQTLGVGQARLGATDTAVLVVSDTLDGMLAATWNALALAGGNLNRIHLLSDPERFQQMPGPAGRVLLARIPGMDTGTQTGFHVAMRGLGLLGRALYHHSDRDFEFHLSGGFKASIPYLIGMAEGLRSLAEVRQVQAWVLHEPLQGTARPIKIPLRRAVPEDVLYELAGFDSSRRRTDIPDENLLEGYAYDTREDGQHLTPFGSGLLALFGDRVPQIIPS